MRIRLNSNSELIQLDTVFNWNTHGGKADDLIQAIGLIQENLDVTAANSIRRLLAKSSFSKSDLISRFNFAFEKQGLGEALIKVRINLDGASHTIEYQVQMISEEVVESWNECLRTPYWHFTTLRAAINPKFMAEYKE